MGDLSRASQVILTLTLLLLFKVLFFYKLFEEMSNAALSKHRGVYEKLMCPSMCLVKVGEKPILTLFQADTLRDV